MAGPLAGIKVLDHGTAITSPFCAMMLGEMGAEVIKIETPHGRDTAADIHHGTPVHYHSFNRGKRNIALDTKTEAGREAVRKLAAEADVYLQNMRPGVAEKMGLGYDALSALNPRLVYCSISGYGDFGPYRDRMAYDAVMQGMTGFAVMQGSKAPGLKPGSASDGPVRDSSPEMLNSLVVDKITSYTACQSIVAALYARDSGSATGGTGQHLRLSMLDAGIFFFWPDAMAQRNFNLVQPPPGDPRRDLDQEPELSGAEREAELERLWADPQHDDGSAEWEERQEKRAASQFCYPTKDGAAAMMFWRNCQWYPRICAAFDPTGGTWLAEQERLMLDPAAELLPAMAAVWATLTNAEIDALFKEHDLPGNSVVDIDSLHLHPQVIAGESIIQRDLGGRHGVVREPRMSTLFEKTPTRMGGASPWRGQHTAEVLLELGLTAGEIEAMEEEGVFGALGKTGQGARL